MTEQNTRATLYKKIAAVTAAVSRIPKNGHNKFFNYDYATESDITDSLRALLNEHGLAFLPPSVIAWERNETGSTTQRGDANTLTRVQMQFGLACTETGEIFNTMLWGEGADSGDKGFYKAYTGAVKYYLMKTFLIATGDDPERDDEPPARKPAARPSGEPPAPRQPARPAPAPATNGHTESPRAQKIARVAALLNDATKAGVKIALDKPLAKQSDAELDITTNAIEIKLGKTAGAAALSDEWNDIDKAAEAHHG